MIGTVTLEIPLKSYLKKYLSKKYGNIHHASRDSWLGAYVIDILDKEFRKSKSVIKKEASYPVVIPFSVVNEVGFSISKVKLLRLAVMIRKVFLNDLYSYIEVSKTQNLKVLDQKHNSIIKQNTIRAIAQFLEFYDISEDELSPDSLYRQYHRDKERSKKKELPVKHYVI